MRNKRPQRIRNEGEYLFVCDRCGLDTSNLHLREEWNGLVVCEWCYEDKHPLLEPFIVPEEQYITSPMRPRADIEAPECTVQGSLGVAGYGVAGCMVTGRENLWLKGPGE
jgi:hypothetical protein